LRSELGKAHEELEQEKVAARRAQALVEMATLLAHEIRNPLASLELFAGLLADASAQNSEARRWADHLQGGMRSLAATVNNVLLLHGHGEPRRVSTNLLRLIGETVEFLEPLARQRGMSLEFVRQAGRAEIDGDANLLRQAFFNIALNALRAMNPGGRLRVTIGPAQHERRAVPVRFEDDGCGIAEEHLQKIFDAGFTTGSGAGIGLAVTRKILRLHGAHIEVRSSLGAGTTVECWFSLSGAEA
jgi:two-component system sensor histidine kinase FlrB